MRLQARKLTYLVGGPADSAWKDTIPALLGTDVTTDADESLYANYVLVNLNGATWDAGAQARAASMAGQPVYAFGAQIEDQRPWWWRLCQYCNSLQTAVDAINSAAGAQVEQEKGREAA